MRLIVEIAVGFVLGTLILEVLGKLLELAGRGLVLAIAAVWRPVAGIILQPPPDGNAKAQGEDDHGIDRIAGAADYLLETRTGRR